jgi:2-iminobutanoate/2-iminopropanoate deaminase
MSSRDTYIHGSGTTLSGAAPLMADAVRFGDMLFLSGRAAVDPATGALRGEDFETQATAVLNDVRAVLAALGSDLGHVLRVECWLRERSDFGVWNRLFADTFPQPRPARTTLVADFPLAGLLIEVQVTAAVAR